MNRVVVDTSALLAILQGEPAAEACSAALSDADEILVSAGTFAEALIVAQRRKLSGSLERLLDGLGVEIVPVTAAGARQVAVAQDTWGKGMHPAALNFGVCFGYALASERQCPLLFVGGDFSRAGLPSLV